MTNQPNKLAQLFAEHNGKVSDKWSIYITEYDRIFHAYRDCSVRLLEIGVQNGGSLEIWGKFFTHAIKLIGCDINPDCNQLQFDDPRITVVVADANTDETQQQLLKLSPDFDLIIDDGSHHSGDIVHSFARYFTHLNDGGLYIAEDLHCSYWQDFEGGLFQPYSSIAFFKKLADTINHEHWGIDKTRTELLRSFNRQYNTRLDEVCLAHIHSIEFINSMCVVRKAIPADNVLGRRFVAGTIALVDEAPLPLHGHSNTQPNQGENQWATKDAPEDEVATQLQRIISLNQLVTDRDEKIQNIRLVSTEREQAYNSQIAHVRQQLESRLVDLVEREKEYSQKLQNIQQSHEQQKNEFISQYAEREEALNLQLSQVRQQLESKLIYLVEREKAYFQQLQNIQQSHEQQKIEMNQQSNDLEQRLNEQLQAKQIEVIELEGYWSDTQAAHLQMIDQLQHELNSIRTSYAWRGTAPLRYLMKLLSHNEKDQLTSLPKFPPVQILPMTERQPSNGIPHPCSHSALEQKRMDFDMPLKQANTSTLTLEDLLSYHDEQFIDISYRTLLNRGPDHEGMHYYLSRLRHGISKIEILIQISKSAEGKAIDVVVDGLDKEIKRHQRSKIPMLGNLIKFFSAHKTIGSIQQNLRVIDNHIHLVEKNISQKFNDIELSIDQILQLMVRLNQQIAAKENLMSEIYSDHDHSSESEQTIKVVNSQAISHAALSQRLDNPIANDPGILKDKSKLIAFYLPQFHRIKENSEWWGPGFTEWTNTVNAKPNFKGHIQPHVPRELGFYDLSNIDIIYEQAEMAKNYGIYGFCFYYYWFSGRRILERPLDNFLESDVDMPFCLCWANENWTRTWDGDEKSVLLGQEYAENEEEVFIKDILPFLKDSRYIQIDGKPMLLIYRIKHLPDPISSIQKLRIAAEQNGLLGLHIAVVDFYDISDPREVGADALVEFPPHKFNGAQNHPNPMPEFTNLSFRGGMVDYKKIVEQSVLRDEPDFTLYRGIIPGWDNTARRQDTPTIIINNSPELYGDWLNYLRGYSRSVHSNKSDSIIFINAWNEWGEGCHLEPDLHWGLRFLEETLRSSWFDGANDAVQDIDKRRKQFLLKITEMN